jgi:hypothetical protein
MYKINLTKGARGGQWVIDMPKDGSHTQQG